MDAISGCVQTSGEHTYPCALAFVVAVVVLGCVVLVGTGEFFEAEDNVLQGFDVRDLVQRWDLQLIEQPLHRVRVEPLGNSFQTVQAARCGLQHLKDLPFDGCVAD